VKETLGVTENISFFGAIVYLFLGKLKSLPLSGHKHTVLSVGPWIVNGGSGPSQ